jgi:hypothetical protein
MLYYFFVYTVEIQSSKPEKPKNSLKQNWTWAKNGWVRLRCSFIKIHRHNTISDLQIMHVSFSWSKAKQSKAEREKTVYLVFYFLGSLKNCFTWLKYSLKPHSELRHFDIFEISFVCLYFLFLLCFLFLSSFGIIHFINFYYYFFMSKANSAQ